MSDFLVTYDEKAKLLQALVRGQGDEGFTDKHELALDVSPSDVAWRPAVRLLCAALAI